MVVLYLRADVEKKWMLLQTWCFSHAHALTDSLVIHASENCLHFLYVQTVKKIVYLRRKELNNRLRHLMCICPFQHGHMYCITTDHNLSHGSCFDQNTMSLPFFGGTAAQIMCKSYHIISYHIIRCGNSALCYTIVPSNGANRVEYMITCLQPKQDRRDYPSHCSMSGHHSKSTVGSATCSLDALKQDYQDGQQRSSDGQMSVSSGTSDGGSGKFHCHACQIECLDLEVGLLLNKYLEVYSVW